MTSAVSTVAKKKARGEVPLWCSAAKELLLWLHGGSLHPLVGTLPDRPCDRWQCHLGVERQAHDARGEDRSLVSTGLIDVWSERPLRHGERIAVPVSRGRRHFPGAQAQALITSVG